MPDAIRIVVPWDPNRTSENRVASANRFARSHLMKTAKELARMAWLAAGKPTSAVPVRVSVIVRRGRRMDDWNIPGACKPLIDGLFVRGVTPDDGPRWVHLGGVRQETGKRWAGREECEFIIEALEGG